MCLNGKLLALTDGPLGANTTLPALIPRRVEGGGGALMLQPLSYAMIVLPDAKVDACR